MPAHVQRRDQAPAAVGVEVSRRDVVELSPPKFTAAGFMQAEGFITKAGVRQYQLPDGTVSRELQPPEELFSTETIDSFHLVPLTLEHPPEDQDVTPENARTFMVGTVGRPERDGPRARSTIIVHDAGAIKAARGGANQLSIGYRALLIPTPGVWTNADGTQEKYDGIQTRIRGNHVALTTRGRAGPDVRMRTDSENKAMEEEITINGVTYKVPKAVAEQIRRDSAAATEAAKAKEAADGKASALEAQIAQRDKADKERNASDADKQRRDAVNVEVQQRLEVISKAGAILGQPMAELMRKDSDTLIAEAIKKEQPEVSIEGRSPEYLRAYFDALASSRKDTAQELAKLVQGDKSGETDTKRADGKSLTEISLAARDEMVKRQREAWKPKAS